MPSPAPSSKPSGWTPEVEFDQGLARTIDWYCENTEWVERVRSGAYREYYEANYSRREQQLDRLSMARVKP